MASPAPRIAEIVVRHGLREEGDAQAREARPPPGAGSGHNDSTNGHNDTAQVFTVAFIWGLNKDSGGKCCFSSQFYRQGN